MRVTQINVLGRGEAEGADEGNAGAETAKRQNYTGRAGKGRERDEKRSTAEERRQVSDVAGPRGMKGEGRAAGAAVARETRCLAMTEDAQAGGRAKPKSLQGKQNPDPRRGVRNSTNPQRSEYLPESSDSIGDTLTDG